MEKYDVYISGLYKKQIAIKSTALGYQSWLELTLHNAMKSLTYDQCKRLIAYPAK